MIDITIGNKQYKVIEAKTEQERKEGLTNYDKLPEDEGMLFFMDGEKSQYVFTMKNMKFPLTQSQMRNRFSAISGIVLKQIME